MKLYQQKFGYGKLPTKKFLENLYIKNTLQQIADKLGTTKTRVRKWFDLLKIEKLPRGFRNNFQFDLPEKKLRKMVNSGMTNIEIKNFFGCSRGVVTGSLRKFGIRRNFKTTELQKYRSRVYWLSDRNYRENIDQINPNRYKRTLCGTKNGYQLDHIKSVVECFRGGITIEQASDISNLQLIPWRENLTRRNFSHGKINS